MSNITLAEPHHLPCCHLPFVLDLVHTGVQAKDLAGVTDIQVLRWANPDPSRVHLVKERVDYQVLRRPQVAQLVANT